MKALIVDDEPHVIAVAQLLVDWKKHQIDQVFTCGDSREALEVIQQERPAVILSDIRMPGLDGLSLIEKVKEIDPAIRTILISAYSDFSYAQKAVSLGCVAYLLKPLTEEGLNQALAQAVSQYNSERSLLTQSLRTQAQNLLSYYLSSGRSAHVFKELTEAAPFFRDLSKCRLGLIQFPNDSPEYDELHHLSTWVNDFFYQKELGAAAVWNDTPEIFLLLLSNDHTSSACEEMTALLKLENIISFSFGLSDIFSFPEGWEKAYIAARKAASSSGEDTLQQIHQYIQDRFAEPLSLDFLADHFAISSSYLSRSFKKRYQIGLVDFITQVRMEKARQLIQSSPLPLTEIAAAVGIPDPKYFSRVFKRAVGCSPAEYRAKEGRLT